MSDVAVDDYYVLLDVDPLVGSSELRRAWRRLVLEWHPDRAGVGATEMFRKLSAAYEVLSDPVARTAYDRRRRTAHESKARVEVRPQSPPSAPPGPPRRAPSAMLLRLTGSIDSLVACGVARRSTSGVVELFVTAAEAAQGGMATISMRVDVRCPACADGPGADSCARCSDARTVRELFSAWLAMPPGVADGSLLAPSVELRGMTTPVRFRVRIVEAV